MIRVSDEFKRLMRTRTNFKGHAEVTLANGETLTLGDDELLIEGHTMTDGAGASGLPLGAAICRTIQLMINNRDGRLDRYDFFGARIRFWLTFALSETVERIEMGTFTVTEPEVWGETVTITAGDDMTRADRLFAPSREGEMTLGDLFRDVCDQCGISFLTSVFANSDFRITPPTEGEYTCRQMLGYIAMIAGGNARIDRTGSIEVLSYDMAGEPDHDLTDWAGLTVDTDDVLVTGLEAETEDGTVLEGDEGYVLTVENPLIEGQEAAALARMGTVLLGLRFRKFAGKHVGYPLAECMDTIRFSDRRGRKYTSIITDVVFTIGSYTELSNSAEGVVRNGSRYVSGETRAKIAARKMVDQERRRSETAEKNLNESLERSSGMYCTEVKQPDGSSIYYLHDKKTMAESTIVTKATVEAIGFSTDGGKTFPYGVTVNGETIMAIVEAEGVSADWVSVGILQSQPDKEGKRRIWMNLDTGEGYLDVDSLLIKGTSVTDMVDSKISITAEEITSAVSKTYSTKTELDAAKTAAADDATAKAAKALSDAKADTDERLKSYSTTVQMNSAISQTAEEITSAVSKTYSTKTELDAAKTAAADDATAKAAKALSDAKADTDERLKSYSTTVEMNSAISQTAEKITSAVSKTYSTKTELDAAKTAAADDATAKAAGALSGAIADTAEKLKSYSTTVQMNSAISQTAESIRSEVSETYATRTALSSVEQTADKIAWLVKSGTSASNFELTDRAIKLVAQTIDLSGYVTFTNLSTKGQTTIDGGNLASNSVTADKISVNDLSALGATIGGWNIDSGGIHNSLPYTGAKNSNSTGMGTYGTDWAFWAGNGRFWVRQSGAFYAESGTIAGWTLSPGWLTGVDPATGRITAMQSPAANVNWVFAAGGTNPNDYSDMPFRVDKEGNLYANSASISGTISAGGTYWGGLSSATGSVSSLSGSLSSANLLSCGTYGTSFSVAGGGSITSYSGAAAYGSGGITWIRSGGAYHAFNGSKYSCPGSISADGSISCSGTKNRTMTTQHYGKRQLDAYETPLPTFSDYGTAVLNETGEIYIVIDPIFAETVDETYLPTVFLTKYGQGDIWVEQVEHDVVVVRGTPGLRFAWETRYAQANAGLERLRVMDYDYADLSMEQDFEGEAALAYEHSAENIDYAQEGYEYLTNLERSLTV